MRHLRYLPSIVSGGLAGWTGDNRWFLLAGVYFLATIGSEVAQFLAECHAEDHPSGE